MRSIRTASGRHGDLNIGVWEDDSGRRVPVTRIQSFQGAEHCTWTDITVLLIGREETADWYVRDTSGGDFSELLRTTFANEATLPEGATDMGLRRDGRQLWIGPEREAAYMVSLDDAQKVERWGRRPSRPSGACERRIVAIDILADPARLRHLDLTILDS